MLFSINSITRRSITITLLCIVLTFTNFVVSAQLADEDAQAVKSGEKSIVLLQITGAHDGKPWKPLESKGGFLGTTILCLGGFKEGGVPAVVYPNLARNKFLTKYKLNFLSKESRDEGWAYLVLVPGTYYLSLLPPELNRNMMYTEARKVSPGWKFHVPGNTKVIYIGRFHGVISGDAGWFAQPRGVSLDLAFDDESVQAVWKQHLLEFEPPRNASMTAFHHTDPKSIGVEPVTDDAVHHFDASLYPDREVDESKFATENQQGSIIGKWRESSAAPGEVSTWAIRNDGTVTIRSRPSDWSYESVVRANYSFDSGKTPNELDFFEFDEEGSEDMRLLMIVGRENDVLRVEGVSTKPKPGKRGKPILRPTEFSENAMEFRRLE